MMCIIIFFTIVALLYHVVIRDQAGRLRQSVSLQARRVNVIVINDDHHRSNAADNRTNGGATLGQVCNDDANETGDQMANIKDVIRNMLLGLIMQRHIIERMEENGSINVENEYEESDEETVIDFCEDNPPSYQNTVKSEGSSSDDDEI